MYNIGDEVMMTYHPQKLVGEVINIYNMSSTQAAPQEVKKYLNNPYISDSVYYEVVFHNKNYLPNKMWIPESSLSLALKDGDQPLIKSTYYANYKCPICSTPWSRTIHPIFGKKVIWEDCLKCNNTKEKIIETYFQKDKGRGLEQFKK